MLDQHGWNAHAFRKLAVDYLASPEGRYIHEGSTLVPYDEYLVEAAKYSTIADSVLISAVATTLVIKVEIFTLGTSVVLRLLVFMTMERLILWYHLI